MADCCLLCSQVTFHEKVKTRSVTLEGDVFDPSGTLSGGARSQAAGVLQKLQELAQARDLLLQAETAVGAHQQALQEAVAVAARFAKQSTERDMKANELEVLLVQLDSNVHYKVRPGEMEA